MGIFKCKMCGGTLEISGNETVAVCQYCGTKQTLPKLDDEKRAQLYDRANHFRRENEFDKAMGIYEMILADDNEDAEAYWGIVLCKYGIEYVEDPATHKRVPTVNRAQYVSVFDDSDYQSAIQYADGYPRDIYEAEAKAIDEIQKGILEISAQEEPFDVFICYKEADGVGNRTEDSVYAQEIYNALVKEGYKVFFSRITLESKLGQQYEPYIFAALHSAKVMLVVGTSKENFNSAWVKNEWSRFLALAKEDKTKTIIPCYKDISPYDMPEEFTYLQSQDMGKIGYVQDIVRGVNKLITEEQKTSVSDESSKRAIAEKVRPLLEEAGKAIENSEWDKANELCDEILGIDPEDGKAYLLKLMSDYKATKFEQLADSKIPFDNNDNYLSAIRYVNPSTVRALAEYNKAIKKRIVDNKKSKSKRRKKTIVLVSIIIILLAAIIALIFFVLIPEIKVSNAKKLINEGKYEEAYAILTQIGRQDEISKNKYNRANELFEKEEYVEARKMFQELGDYADSKEKAQEVFNAIREMFGNNKTICVGDYQCFAIDVEGKVKTTCLEDGVIQEMIDVSDWTDITSIATNSLGMGIVGLKTNGTVVAKGRLNIPDTELTLWKDVVDIAVGYDGTYDYAVGLKSDGSVYYASGNNAMNYFLKDIYGWTDIVSITASTDYVVGLKSDGTVVAVGKNLYGRCDIYEWRDIVAISAGYDCTIGLKMDGTVVVAGNLDNKFVSDWCNIVSVVAYDSVFGVKIDGSVVTCGSFDTSSLTDVVSLSKRYDLMCLRTDNTAIVYSGFDNQEKQNEYYNKMMNLKSIERDYSLIEKLFNYFENKTPKKKKTNKKCNSIIAGDGFSIGITADGNVLVVGESQFVDNEYPDDPMDRKVDNYINNDLIEISTWKNIDKIKLNIGPTGGGSQVGLKKDGTVIVTNTDDFSKETINKWNGISDVFINANGVFGLKRDGTLVSPLFDSGLYSFDPSNRLVLVATSCDSYHICGLKQDGTVVCLTSSEFENEHKPISDWSNIIDLYVLGNYTIGVKNDGTVVTNNISGKDSHEMTNWSNITSITMSENHYLGLKSDGTVVAAGNNNYGQCNVSDWTDVVAVFAGNNNSFGLKSDGTVVATGDNTRGQCNVSDWTDIIAISASATHTLGLKSDGTVVATGNNDNGQCNVSEWSNIKTD